MRGWLACHWAHSLRWWLHTVLGRVEPSCHSLALSSACGVSSKLSTGGQGPGKLPCWHSSPQTKKHSSGTWHLVEENASARFFQVWGMTVHSGSINSAPLPPLISSHLHVAWLWSPWWRLTSCADGFLWCVMWKEPWKLTPRNSPTSHGYHVSPESPNQALWLSCACL